MKVFVENVAVNTKKDGVITEVVGKMFIESDSMQFMVNVYSGLLDSKGNEKYKTLGYFPSVDYCLKFIVKQKVMQSTAETLVQLLEDFKRIESFIHTQVKV